MMVSTKGRYALRVMIELAGHDAEKFIPLKEIAKNQEISEKYLESIIKLLVKDGMVIGLRGKGGGYRLAKVPAAYTAGSILRLTEGSLAPVACLDPHAEACPRTDKCSTLSFWKGLDTVITDYLESITLEDLHKQASESAANDYII